MNPLLSIRQGEDAEFVEHVWPIGDGWKQPVYVLFVDTLWEEGNDPKDLSRIGAEFSEH